MKSETGQKRDCITLKKRGRRKKKKEKKDEKEEAETMKKTSKCSYDSLAGR